MGTIALIEELSATDGITATNLRTLQFLHAGVGEVWLIDPSERALMIFALGKQFEFLEAEDIVPIDPPFRVADFFALPGQS